MRQHALIAERCQLDITFGNALLPDFAIPAGLRRRQVLPRPPRVEEPSNGGATYCPTPCVTAPPTSSRSSTTWACVILPDHLGPHPLRPRMRHQGRSGSRLGGRVRGRLLPADHRPRPDQVRPCCSNASPPAGSRCPTSTWTSTRGTRSDDPLRGRPLRPRSRRPDHHVRNDQGPQRGAWRGACSATRTASATRSPRRCRRS